MINGQYQHKSASARCRCKKGGENAEEAFESADADKTGGLSESIESPHQENQGIGVSRGGKNTKIHALVDGLGNPIKLIFTTGNTSDTKVATDLLSGIDINGSIVMGDKAYGSKDIRDFIVNNGGTYAIPPKSNAIEPWECDWWQYKERHLVECFFNKLKHFRRVATRYDKLLSRFASFVFLASSMILLK